MVRNREHRLSGSHTDTQPMEWGNIHSYSSLDNQGLLIQLVLYVAEAVPFPHSCERSCVRRPQYHSMRLSLDYVI